MNLRDSGIVQMGSVDNLKRAELKDFFRDAERATSFLSIPGFKSHGSQSGPVFGILKQMLDDFEAHLYQIKSEEKKANNDY